MEHETALIKAFVLPAKRNRLAEQLRSEKRRPKLLASLDHFRDLDHRFLVEIAPSEQNASGIENLLVQRGAPPTCHLISSNRELDGQIFPLNEALWQVIGRGEGTLISCIPGRLGYFEGESSGNRFILERVNNPRSRC